VDKTNHRFGYVENREINGAAKCVQPERFEKSFPQTKVLQKTVEDYIEVTKDELGKPKNLGQSSDPNMVFGAKIRRPGEDEAWNAALCIYGDPSSKTEIEPDKDLGKCTKANCTNTVRYPVCEIEVYYYRHPEDSNRVFGVPTIRTDIPKKDKKSIADHQNYGNEPGAVELLFPSSYLEFGVTEEDFNAPRTKDEIKVIFENGKEVKREIAAEKILKEPINGIIEEGSRTTFVSSRGQVTRFVRVLKMTATAYDATFKSCGKHPEDPNYGITYSGLRVKPGIVAVDPKVIPLGTHLYVEGYGEALAADKGGAIKGNRIDLYYESPKDVARYGKRTVKVYVLDKPRYKF
jgi:3D (Asp-Asp-Asp) domain-containing protein